MNTKNTNESTEKTTLTHWSIDCYMIAHGVVHGHKKLEDSILIHTSKVLDVVIDEKAEEAIITTRNTVYHCKLQDCNFKEQDEYPIAIKDYKSIKEKYKNSVKEPEIEHGKILLVLANFNQFYFHSLCIKDENGNISEYEAFPHVGTFKDSFLIISQAHKVDLRYFPNYKSIEFYCSRTNNLPLIVENIGTCDLQVELNGYKYTIKPGERQELIKENAVEDSYNPPSYENNANQFELEARAEWEEYLEDQQD